MADSLIELADMPIEARMAKGEKWCVFCRTFFHKIAKRFSPKGHADVFTLQQIGILFE